MRSKRIIPLLVILLCSLFLNQASGLEKTEESVVVSVDRVIYQIDKNKKVTIYLKLHAPSKFGGFDLALSTDSKDRAEVRARFPKGGLYVIDLPKKTLKELEAQVISRNRVEETLDSGVDPYTISQFFVVPSVKLSELDVKPMKATVVLEDEESRE